MSDRGRKIKIIMIVIAAILLVGIGTALLMLNGMLQKINFAPKAELSYDEIGAMALDEDEDIVSSADTFDQSDMEEFDNSIKELKVDENDLVYQDGVKNILILGTDVYSNRKNKGRSDAIIILSINDNTKKIVMSSILRDTYVPIPGRPSSEKITHAHAYGGPELSTETVEGAFGIRIDNYASVNFQAFIGIVDAFGGVDIDVTNAERTYLNTYIRQINRYAGLNSDDGILRDYGENMHLTGKQALGYCRVRYTAGGDSVRSERHREVFEQLINKARSSDYLTLLNALNTVADNLTTDYSRDELIKLMLKAGDYKNYEITQIRLPIPDTYIAGIYHGRWVLRIDFEKNREALYNAIYE